MNNIYPLLRRISDKLHSINDDILDEHIVNIRNVYTLCSDQIRKCFITLLEVIKLEHKENVSLQVKIYLKAICKKYHYFF